MSRKIGFIGAGGMLGTPVAKQLIKAGFEVQALARDPEKLKAVVPGIDVTKGDLKNQKDLDTFMQGKDIVYLNLSIKQNEKPDDWHTEKEGLELILESCKKHGVKRIAYLSSIVMFYQGIDGFNWWVFELKHRAVERIKKSGIAYTIFYPSVFMESLMNQYKMGNKMMLAGTSNSKMYWIAAEDYGRQVAAALNNEKSAKREYFIQGPEAFTVDEAVDKFISCYRKEKLSISRAPLGIIKFFGLFNQKMNYGANIITALNNYPEIFKAEESWNELGKPQMNIEQFAASVQK
jgi:uncharacterized protein YbjT (DUF2867 family)